MIMLTQDDLRDIFKYDVASGNFIRIKKLNRNTRIGEVAGTVDEKGHVTIGVRRKRYTHQQIFDIYHCGKITPTNRYRGARRDQ